MRLYPQTNLPPIDLSNENLKRPAGEKFSDRQTANFTITWLYTKDLSGFACKYEHDTPQWLSVINSLELSAVV
jgi:hypothetical protein